LIRCVYAHYVHVISGFMQLAQLLKLEISIWFCFVLPEMLWLFFSFVVIGIVVVKEIQFCVKNSILRLLNYKTKLY
jgi:hypothetical protein